LEKFSRFDRDRGGRKHHRHRRENEKRRAERVVRARFRVFSARVEQRERFLLGRGHLSMLLLSSLSFVVTRYRSNSSKNTRSSEANNDER